MSDVILVLGMHRSGTSATAGVLTKLGGGLPKHLMKATPANQKGYFESVTFMLFHDELLTSAGTDWRDWRSFNQGWVKSSVAGDFRRRAKDLFEAEFGGAPLPVLKDPRICRFAPFWLDVLREMQLTPHIVMPIRSPLDVAKSIKSEHGLSLTHGMLMWLRHVLDAEWSSRSQPRSIFAWQDFVSDWRSICDKIAVEAQLSWPRLSDRASREIDRFLSKELVHHNSDISASSDIHDWTRRTYDALMELSRNPQSNSALSTLDDVRAVLDQSSKIFGRLLIENEIDLEEASGQVAALSGQVNEMQARQVEVLAEKAAAVAELVARAERAEAERAEVARNKDALARELATELQLRQQEQTENAAVISALTTRADKAEAERDSHNEELAKLATELQLRQQELAANLESLSVLAGRTDQAEAQAAEAARYNETLAKLLVTTERERDLLSEERSRIAAELRTGQQELAEKAEAVIEFKARADRAEAAAQEAAQVNDALSRELESVRNQRDLVEQERARIAAVLHDQQQALADKAAALASAEEERLTSAQAMDALARELESVRSHRDSVEQERARIAAVLHDRQQELIEKQTVVTDLTRRVAQAEAQRDAEKNSKESAIQSFDAARRTSAVQLEALRTDLMSAEAALAHVKANVAQDGLIALLSPAARKRRRTAKILLDSGLFDKQFYLKRYPNALPGRTANDPGAGLAAAEHYVDEGFLKGYFPNPYFDTRWYLETYDDVRRAGVNPLLHYLLHGVQDGRDAGPRFQTKYYLETNPDVRDSGQHPFAHYLRHGRHEGRLAVRPT